MPQVKLFGSLRNQANMNNVNIDGQTVGEVLQRLCITVPALRASLLDENIALVPFVRVIVNGRDIELIQGLDTLVVAADDLSIFPPLAGG